MAKKKDEILNDELKDASLMDILASGSSSNIFKKNTLIDYSYRTGIPIIDYTLGYEVLVRDETGKVIKKRKVLGLQAGSFNSLSGKSQSFKTTIGMQIMSNIGTAYDGNIVHYDGEGRLVLQRAKQISGLPDDWNIPDWATDNLIRQVIGAGFPPKFSEKLLETMPQREQ